MSQLNYARYGKDNVRLYKVHKHPDGTQSVVEQTVRVLLEGDIETSYTQADNSVVVATDTQKHTVYVLAKQNPVTPPELFASIVGTHFITKYSHIHAAHVKIVTHKWTRMTVDGKPHPHSFLRDGEDIRTVEAVIREGKGVSIKSGIDRLLVLKSTGSAFYGFHRDEYTRLGETWDRILSTEVKAEWQWKEFSGLEEVKTVVPKFDEAFNAAKAITLDTFAKDSSASVQNTMYKMSDQILAAAPLVETVSYSLPNKHYFEIDLSWFKGTKNTGADAEVFAPQSDPNGLIQCTVGRKGSKAKL
ncbi:putative urate oxidase protein [Neofusicoccum parvum]|uniref:Uricase n=2 Tax=Neofusicoccum parvum TaxID=310453 RepID=R1GI94_BOTPV|nr:putative urate oxidase protein [Neofusicoccum parvum UCRNP2]GME38862.1 putative urate oxidase protein [Neofusicoccum parvum]GME65504.1 putative urate oxidase protein [Neofusicoccum parvum]